MKRNLLLLFVLFFVVAILPIMAADGENTSKRQENKVLVLSSYYQGYGWAGALESSIVSHFSVDRKWNVEVDYLDLLANRDSSFMHQTAERLMDEHDANNILVLQNWLERIRKEVTNKVLSIKRISDYSIIKILAQPTLKKIL